MPSVGSLRPAVLGTCALAVVLLALGGAAPGSARVTGTATAPVPCTCEGIGGTVSADRGADGALDPAAATPRSPGPGRAHRGDRARHPLEVRTATAPDGRLLFSVPAGTYRVTAPQPAGFDDGPDVPGPGATADGDDAFLVVLPAGGSGTGTAFAELPRSGLGGAVFDDLDGDRSRSGAGPGIPGVPVALTGTGEAGNARRHGEHAGMPLDRVVWHPRASAGTHGPLCAGVIGVMLAP